MSRTGLFLFIAIVAITTGFGLWLAGCGDKPNQPPKPEPKDYVFYLSDGSYRDRYFLYHSCSRDLDTITIPYGSQGGFAVSPDGSLLYLCDRTLTRVVTTDSLQLVAELPPGYISVSPDNQFLAIAGSDSIVILRTDDYSAVYSDTFNFLNGRFSNDSQTYYGNGQHHLLTVRLTDPVQTSDRTFTGGGVYRFVPSPDDSQLYLYVLQSVYDFLFAVVDVASDSILFQTPITPGYGDIEITPDGKHVFYTSPGHVLIGPDPSPYLTVYNTEREQIQSQIPIVDFGLPGNLAVSPDGRKLMAAGATGEQKFFVLDISTLTITELYELRYTSPADVVCQNSL